MLLILAIIPVLYEKMPGRKYGLWYSAIFPFITGWLLVGGEIYGFGFEPVDTAKFGGILLTLILGVTGISFSLPIGIALALGRRSKMPILRSICVIFIEFFRMTKKVLVRDLGQFGPLDAISAKFRTLKIKNISVRLHKALCGA